jgi:hypothetical protein
MTFESAACQKLIKGEETVLLNQELNYLGC